MGNFFAIDGRVWGKLCALGMSPAAAYLVLARFTGGDNRTTSASTNAVETYTSIARTRARAAIAALIRHRHMEELRGGTRPLYRLGGFVEQGAARLRALSEHGVWLPNALVTGAAGETPPVELVRQTQDPMTLRLLVDLYDVQNLREDGGVSRGVIWQQHERFQAGQRGQFVVYGFRYKSEWVHWSHPVECHRREPTKAEKKEGKNDAADFFRRLGQLVSLGLVQWVPHLYESEMADAEPIHPYGMGETDSIEDRLGMAAHRAGAALLTENQLRWAEDKRLSLAPVPAHITSVAMIGVARLRYRPRTKLTAAWWAELNAKGEDYITQYKALAENVRQAASA